MGNQHSTVGDSAVSDPTFLEGLEKIGGMGTYQLWKRTPTGEEYEQYNIYSGQGLRFEKDRQIYQFRKRQRLNLVAVEHMDVVSNPYSCPGYQQLRVFTERIQLRLRDLQHLSLRYAIFIIKEAVVGFKAILSHFGYMPINDNLIGFNCSSKVRVWVNPNFGSNEPHTCFKVRHGYGNDEFNMLCQLFEAVESHISQTPELEMFRAARLLHGSGLDFQSVSTFLSNFCIEQRIMMPQKFQISMIGHNVKPHYEREESVARLTSRIKMYSDASCVASSKGAVSNGQPLNFRTSMKMVDMNAGSQDGSSQGRLTFRKKISSSQPKMSLQAFASPKHIHPQKLHFTAQKKLKVKKEEACSTEKVYPPNEGSLQQASEHLKAIGPSLTKMAPETPTNPKHIVNRLSEKEPTAKGDIYINSENRVRKPGFFANQPPLRNSSDLCDFLDQHKRNRNKHLTSSCQPIQHPLNKSTEFVYRSGMFVQRSTDLYGQRRVGGLGSPELNHQRKLTHSIVMSDGKMPPVPFIHITSPNVDLPKKEGQDSDCQATNIYNSNNSMDPSAASRSEEQRGLPTFKTNKFEDGVLSSFVAEGQAPKKLMFHDVVNVTESIVENSPKNEHSSPRHWELNRFSGERRVSRYTLFNEKQVVVSQIIKEEKSPGRPTHLQVPRSHSADLLHLAIPVMDTQPDSPCLQNFFAENQLDYQKYKLIMMNRGQKNELKQSITYEQLGRVCQKSRIMDRDNTPMQLDRYAKREVTQSMMKSMTIDQQAFQQSLHNQAKMLSSVIVPYEMEEIQQHETEVLGG